MYGWVVVLIVGFVLLDWKYIVYQPDPLMEVPEDANSLIWRYMDFAKFISLLQRSALFFCKISHLRHDDGFEGTLPEANLPYLDANFKDMPWATELIKRVYSKDLSEMLFVNCWHLNEFESDTMWRLYTQHKFGGLGIAIQTSFRKLCDCFGTAEFIKVGVGKVKYIDYSVDPIDPTYYLGVAMHKREHYRSENEVRAVTFIPNITVEAVEKGNSTEPIKAEWRKALDQQREYGGVYLEVNLQILIEKIYLSPNSPLWYFEVIQSMVRSQGLNIPVVYSALDNKPLT